MMTTVMCKI